MKKIVLTFGLTAGLIQAVLMLSSMTLMSGSGGKNFQMGELIGYATMIISLSLIFFGVRACRDKYLEGIISFGKALRVGVLITLIASALYVLTWMVYYYTGNGQALMEEYFNHSLEQVRQSGAAQEMIDQRIAEMQQFKDMYKSPVVQIGVTFMEIFPVGLIISLISAALLRRKPDGKGMEPA